MKLGIVQKIGPVMARAAMKGKKLAPDERGYFTFRKVLLA